MSFMLAKGTGVRLIFNVLYVGQRDRGQTNIQCPFMLHPNKKCPPSHRTLAGVVCVDMLEEFLMPIPKEDNCNIILFQQDGASASTFAHCSSGGIS